jgi:hypothetical protein
MRFESGLAMIAICMIYLFGVAIPAGASIRSNALSHREISKKTAAVQYLTLVDPANSALDQFASQAQTWTNSTTGAQAEKDAEPSIAALSQVSSGLKRDRWPRKAQRGVKALTKAIVPVDDDLKSLATVNSFEGSTWISTFTKDASALKSAVKTVRRNLGLPLKG